MVNIIRKSIPKVSIFLLRALFIGNWLKIFNRNHPSKLSYQESQWSQAKNKYVTETFEDFNRNVDKKNF